MNWASSLLVFGFNFPRTFSSSFNTKSLFAESTSAFCMHPYGNATAWGVKMSFGNFGCNKDKFKLFDPTLARVISSGVMHQLQPKLSARFIFTSMRSVAFPSSAVAFAASCAGRGFISTSRLPSALHRISTHLPAKSSNFAEMAGSKQVASNTPKFRARTAQCERMSGASFAERTRTPTTPSGTSSSPLTAPLRSTVGVSKTLSWM
mmetsp:Transcript_4749/g.13764  ORF Transcript_4749/g.13764 Transcript_4749/m.13764 type:complete len:206 (+) Transcript_4749:875-1492(+)